MTCGVIDAPGTIEQHRSPVVPWLRPRASRGDVAAHWRELGEHTVPGAGGDRPGHHIYEDSLAVAAACVADGD